MWKTVNERHVREQWDIMKRSNLPIKSIEKGEDFQINVTDRIFNMVIEENFPKIEERQIHTNIRSKEHQTDRTRKETPYGI